MLIFLSVLVAPTFLLFKVLRWLFYPKINKNSILKIRIKFGKGIYSISQSKYYFLIINISILYFVILVLTKLYYAIFEEAKMLS